MPDINLDDTIAAVATASGVGAIGIVRLSGRQAIEIADSMFCGRDGFRLTAAESHTVHFGTICDVEQAAIDQVLVSVFRSPNSYTAEDVVEINAHGGPHILKKILDTVLAHGARHAEPGEFTRRAFVNGRIDLAQAEAVQDLIRAKTDSALKAALQQLTGKFSSEIGAIKNELMTLYAHLEADLDFPDEHLETASTEDICRKFQRMAQALERLIATFSKGHLAREGILTVIVGRPNVGKSSLLNVLLERERALVSDIPGTTRDTLEESVEFGGFSVRLVDTAGLSTSAHPLDQAAMERAERLLGEGSLFLWVLDASAGFTGEDERILSKVHGKPVITVINKTDLPAGGGFERLAPIIPLGSIVYVSAKTGEGVDLLQEKIAGWITNENISCDSFLLTRTRHKRALETALEALEKSSAAMERKESLEFVALDLKRSLDSLRELVGEVYSEDLLDVIFKEFCIGK